MASQYAQHMQQSTTLSEEEQKKIGAPIAGDMSSRHKTFVADIARLLEDGTIDPTKPATFINAHTYKTLSDAWKIKVDRITPNMATLLDHIHRFYRDKQTPDACPQLASMIDQLWEMKERIECHADVFVF